MQKFEIFLKNEKKKSYSIITFLVVALHVLFFIFLLFNESLWKKGVAGLLVSASYIIYKFSNGKKTKMSFYYSNAFFFVFGIVTLLIWLIVIDIILSILYILAFQPLAFEFDNNIIKQKNFPWKKYFWIQLEYVILKDNILTLDFKNNKIIQAEIDDNSAPDELLFNTFAKEQLRISNS